MRTDIEDAAAGDAGALERDIQAMEETRWRGRMRFLASMAAVALAGASLGWCSRASAETVDGRRFVIVDGDTVALGRERIRILNIDAPESFRPRCEAELVAGLKAKERLAALLRAGPVLIDRCEADGRCEDSYGRTLARLSGGGRDIGQVLVTERLALPWRPGGEAWAQRQAHWCGR